MSSTNPDRGRARMRRGGRVSSVLLLVGSLVLAGAGVVEAFRAVRSHQATAESLLRDYGAFAAWTYGQRATEALAASIVATLGPLARPSTACGIDELFESAAEVGEACGCAPGVLGDFAFRFRLSDRPEAIAVGGALPDGLEESALRSTAAEGTRAMEPDSRFTLSALGPAGRGRILAVGRIPTATGPGGSASDTLVFGFDLDPAKVRAVLEEAYRNSDLLPPTLAPEPGIVSVAVLGETGDALFSSSDDGPHPEFAMEERLARPLGGLVARASILPEAADDLIIGGLPRSRLPWLLGLFVLAGALAVGSVRQLRKEQELARLRSDFVASVSHELRTPLAQMRLFAETLRLGRTRSDDERSWFLESIESETLRLGHLVDNVLHFSRSERGGRSGDAPTVDIAREVRGVAESFERLRSSERRPGTRLVTRLDEGLHARIHPDALRQILLNYLDNADKYGPREQTVTVTGRRENGRVRIAVEDEGPGVPPEERERIWEPFRRGHRAVGTVAVGSGIGLAVARTLAESHGGRTSVGSAAGGGARFELNLPAATPDDAATAPPAGEVAA